jgi:hypothetical protein
METVTEQIIIPPIPPLATEEAYEINWENPIPEGSQEDATICETPFIGDGQFNYISDKHWKEMLVNAWQAITLTESWDFVGQKIDSFMFSNDEQIKIISKKMEDLGYYGHSGASFGCIMRTMQYISRYGEEMWKQTL